MTEPVERIDAELADLCRGRGLHDTKIIEKLGPTVRTALRIRHGDDPVVQRDQLRTGLVHASRDLARDLRMAFQGALGLDADGPAYLEDRLKQVAQELHLHPKSARRRLTLARRGVAEHLAGALIRAEANNPYIRLEWQDVRVEAQFRLDLPQPRLIERRTIVAIKDGLRIVTASISLPSPGVPPQIAVIAGEGCEVASILRESPSHLRCDLALPQPLARAQRHQYEVSFVLSSFAGIRPYYVLVPFRGVPYFAAAVHFGTPSVASRVWRLSGVPSSIIEDLPDRAPDFDPAATPIVQVEFQRAISGFCYGLQWEWSESALAAGVGIG